jgi:hypothetical protein
MDVVIRNGIPPGETVAEAEEWLSGGKGANQAAAANSGRRRC